MTKKNYKYADKMKVDWKRHDEKSIVPTGSDHVKVRLSFEYVEPGNNLCLSRCQSDDVRQAIDCFRRMTAMTWVDVIQTATKDKSKKTGLHWTPYKDDAIKIARPAAVSADHRIAGVRAGEKFRVFGFRFGAYFHVLWFDPEHTVCDG
jgi:hypothetical protein